METKLQEPFLYNFVSSKKIAHIKKTTCYPI